MNLSGIQANQINEVWSNVLPALQKVLDKSDKYDADHLKLDLINGDSQLWICWEGDKVYSATVTSIINHPKKKVCLVWLVGGEEIDTWLYNVGIIEEWATAQGCETITTQCRPGWERKLDGWTNKLVVLEKDLRHG